MPPYVQICGAAFALLAFASSLVIGLLVENSFVTLVLRALAALLVFYFLGCLLAVLGQRVIHENFQQEKQRWLQRHPEAAPKQQTESQKAPEPAPSN